MILPSTPNARLFTFDRDTFIFANELVWQYHFDPATGGMRICRNTVPPSYTHRCFVMVRSARQFFYHARFEPGRPVAEPLAYERLIREVVSRSPRQARADSEKVVIPGYDCLRSFSRAHEPLLKANLGGAWQSYFVRSHWRMVAPTLRRHQANMARQLQASFALRSAPIVHLYRFPRITINHGVVLFGWTRTDQGSAFDVYDPNIPDRPLKLEYRQEERSFFFPRTQYWAGGALNVYEMYKGGLY